MDEDTKDVQNNAPTEIEKSQAVLNTVEPGACEEDARETKTTHAWREANVLFSPMRYGISNPFHAWIQTRRQAGDTITSSKKLRYWKKLKTLTDKLGDAELDYIRLLAQKRFEFSAALFRVNAVSSVRLPITAAVVANQLYPGFVQRFIADSPVVLTVLFLFFLILPAVVFGNVFKARELRMALELEAGRRRLHRGELSDTANPIDSEFDLDSPIT